MLPEALIKGQPRRVAVQMFAASSTFAVGSLVREEIPFRTLATDPKR
jgi:hypothetical protein